MPNKIPYNVVNIAKNQLDPLLTDYLEKLEFFENTLKKNSFPFLIHLNKKRTKSEQMNKGRMFLIGHPMI